MASFPVYDPETDSIRLNGGAAIMLTLLMKAKFGERFDPITLFHPQLADLIRQLTAALDDRLRPSGQGFDRKDLSRIAEAVFNDSSSNGWWSKSIEDRTQFLQDAAAPWLLSADETDTIVDDINSRLFRARQIASIAAAEEEP